MKVGREYIIRTYKVSVSAFSYLSMDEKAAYYGLCGIVMMAGGDQSF